MTDLAIILVSWNVRDLVLEALRTLFVDLEQSSLDVQVMVVDSASSDGTVAAISQHFPDVTLIASEENLGFGRGNNAGLRALGFGEPASHTPLPSAVYLLNCDTLTQLGATETLFRALMADETIGVVGARLTYGDGSFQHAGFAFPGLMQLWAEFFPTPGRWIEGRFNGRYPRNNYVGQKPFKVDFMLGASMMLRREVIEETGMFDEQFFMYCEEIDWQWRINKAGWRVFCVPQAHVIHLGGQSTGQVKARSIVDLWESRLYLFEKHYPWWKNWLARKLVVAGMTRKIATGKASGVPDDVVEAYHRVREMAFPWLV